MTADIHHPAGTADGLRAPLLPSAGRDAISGSMPDAAAPAAAEPATGPDGRPAGPPPIAGLRIAVAINAKAGAARGCDRADLEARIAAAVAHVGSLAEIAFVEPRAWRSALTALAGRADVDAVIVGGGDGSVSTAGSIFVDSGKAMGVIPLGTFNLFARSLRIPIGFDAALEALEHSVVESLDVGEVTDGGGRSQVFLHHVSLGVHPRFIEIRDAMPYGSRLGKMLASLRVWRRTLVSMRRLRLSFSGDVERPRAPYYQVAVTVGSFREGLIDFPHAEDLTRGDLDLVAMPAGRRLDFVIAALLAAIGRWRTNPKLDVVSVRRVVVDSPVRRLPVSFDGEVKRRPMPLVVGVRPRALKVLHPPTPAPADDSEAAGW